MKILFYIGAMNGGGAQRVMANLINELSTRSYQIYLAYDMNQPCAFDLYDSIYKINSREGCIPNVWYKKTHFYRKPRYLMNIRRIAKQIKPDVVVSFMTDINADVLIMLRGLRIPIIVSEHTNISRNRGKWVTFIHNYIYPKADVVTLLTQYDYNCWKNRFPNIHYMPNPSDPKDKPFCGPKDKVILSAGRISDWRTKGFDNLILAWSSICDSFPEWKLQIAGAGKENDFIYLESLIKKTQAKNVEFVGFKKDLASLMKKTEIYCLASRHEGLPMVLIEAMNANCCCVAFDCKTGPREIIKHSLSGLLVEDQNVEALSKSLSLVMNNDELRNRLSQNARASVMQYSTTNIVNKWESLFKLIKK